MTKLLITQSDSIADSAIPRTIYRRPVHCTLHTAENDGRLEDFAWLVLPLELPLPWGAIGPITLSLSTLDGKLYNFEIMAHIGEIDLSDRTDVRLRFHGWEQPIVKSYSGFLDTCNA
jgi:hypothetical protein